MMMRISLFGISRHLIAITRHMAEGRDALHDIDACQRFDSMCDGARAHRYDKRQERKEGHQPLHAGCIASVRRYAKVKVKVGGDAHIVMGVIFFVILGLTQDPFAAAL
jgi:hypothetical protein